MENQDNMENREMESNPAEVPAEIRVDADVIPETDTQVLPALDSIDEASLEPGIGQDDAPVNEITEIPVSVEIQETISQVVESLVPDEEPVVIEERIILPSSELIPAATAHSNKRVLQGRVVSNKPDKTIVVAIERQVAHPLYKKYFKRTKKVMAHDPQNSCNEGDTVRVRECRQLSARKRWELLDIVLRAK